MNESGNVEVTPATLSATLDALAERLEAVIAGARPATGADAPAALQAEIAQTFRDARAGAAAFAALEARVRELAARWKALGATPAATASRRTDHLGASTFVEKGWARLAVGDATGAVHALERALSLAPEDGGAEVLLAWARLELGEAAEATRRLDALLARDPSHPLAHAVRGLVALRAGDAAGAEAALAPIAESARDARARLYAHLWRGQGYLSVGAHAEAAACFERALVLGPNLLEAAYDLGRARWAAGDRDGALAAWRHGATANRFNPWSERCAAVITTVEGGGEPPAVGSVRPA